MANRFTKLKDEILEELNAKATKEWKRGGLNIYKTKLSGAPVQLEIDAINIDYGDFRLVIFDKPAEKLYRRLEKRYGRKR